MSEEANVPLTNKGDSSPSSNNNNSKNNASTPNKHNRNRRRKPAANKSKDGKDTATPATGNEEKTLQDSAAVGTQSNASDQKGDAKTSARKNQRRRNNRKANQGNANPAQTPKGEVAVQEPMPAEKVAPAPTKVNPNDPAPTRMRPAMRVQVASPSIDTFPKPLKHDDVILVPGLFGVFDDQSKYKQILEELEELHKQGTKGCEWTDLRGGKFQVVKDPQQSKTVQQVVEKLCSFFQIQSTSVHVRMNRYKDSNAWGPYQHDLAATNASRAKEQNVSVGAMFGAPRELGFASQSSDQRVYFPQNNNDCFLFGRDVNIRFQHGINAMPEGDSGTDGCLLISVCGLATNVVEEEGSPVLVQSNNKKRNGNKQSGNTQAVKQQTEKTQSVSEPADAKETENNAGAPKKNKRRNQRQRQRARQIKKAADTNASEEKDIPVAPATSPAPSHGIKDENEVVEA
eukprot:Nitzschia sp. Nitz4//scaffold32_size149145//60106//61564//NITZ4_002878-RA/size149145-augustus-gene-0.49-mRNA-1//-1//CDS//3329548066//4179//frame0